MKVLISIIIMLCDSYTVMATNISSNRIINSKELLKNNIGYLFVEDNFIAVDKYGRLYSFDTNHTKSLNWKFDISYTKKYSNVNLMSHKKNVLLFAINNKIYSVNIKTGNLQWKKELAATIKGVPLILNNKLIILTIDNRLYTIDVEDGNIIWTHDNGINVISCSYYISPIVSNSKIIVPFSNGELIAFSENGRKLWNRKLTVDRLHTQLTDITSTPKIFDTTLVTTNNSYIYGIDIKSGEILWIRPIEIKSLLETIMIPLSYYGNVTAFYDKQQETVSSNQIFVLTKSNKIIGINIQNGKIVWTSDLINDSKLLNLIYCNNILLIKDNERLFFIFPVYIKSENIKKRFKYIRYQIPDIVYAKLNDNNPRYF